MNYVTKIITLIDADSLLYYSSKDDIFESINTIDERIKDILKQTKAEYFNIFLSQKPYFRHNINPEYKFSRKKKPKQDLKYLRTLKGYLYDKWGAVSIKGLEADDLVCFMYNYYLNICEEEITPYISSPDKDLLQSIEGSHFNYRWLIIDKDTSMESILKGKWTVTTKDVVIQFRMFQLLKGDITDDIKGIPEKTKEMKDKYGLDNRRGFGDLSVKKIIEYIISNNLNYEEEIISIYKMYYGEKKGVEEYIKVKRQITLLSTNDDMIRELGHPIDIVQRMNVSDFIPYINPDTINNNEEPLF